MSSLSVDEHPAMKKSEAYRRYTIFESEMVESQTVVDKGAGDLAKGRPHLCIQESCTFAFVEPVPAEKHLL